MSGPVFFRDYMFRLINLETLLYLAYSFSDSKRFALLIKESNGPALFL